MMTAALASISALALLASAPSAQVLADLQPGRNFVSSSNFGTGRSTGIEAGDVDNDGDMDVVVGNGGDGGPQMNRIYINNGGLQGGLAGTFTDDTAARFAGVPADTSESIRLADHDNDGDLDVFVPNRGTTFNGGEVSRFYTNLGGLQGGTVGFFTESTDTRWGTLIAVPESQQVHGGNVGPFRDFSCDCEFADMNDDGELDLFHSTYGPNLSGSRDSRIFLNDGSGIFHELWPWTNAAASAKAATTDVEILDFDGDFDLDIILNSRSNIHPARVYLNNISQGIPDSPNLYHEITQFALVAQGAVPGQFSYEFEAADMDGDGDLDLWSVNHLSFQERVLRNDGFVPGSGFRFVAVSSWIRGDPVVNEQSHEFGDFDNDGDLDAFLPNFSGGDSLYQSGLAQGLHPEIDGLYHRTGGGDSLAAAFTEIPVVGGTTLQGGWADVDGDGDLDLLLANDGNAQNRLFRNELGVPDTHAPAIAALRQVAPQPNALPSVVHADVRDNDSFRRARILDVRLHYSVNGGPEQQLAMFHQGGYTFRGVIPAQSDAAISYFITATDPSGNVGVSASLAYAQGNPSGGWVNLGGGLPGVTGIPQFAGNGLLVSGAMNELALTSAAPSAATLLFVSLADNPTPFKGGALHTVPALLTIPLGTDTGGGFALNFPWPASIPSGFELFLQCAAQDGAAVQGVALSNLLRATTP